MCGLGLVKAYYHDFFLSLDRWINNPPPHKDLNSEEGEPTLVVSLAYKLSTCRVYLKAQFVFFTQRSTAIVIGYSKTVVFS